MSQDFKSGDAVTWSAGGGQAEGTVKEKITESQTVDGQQVNASASDPRYLVKNDNTGNTTGHKPESLSKADAKSNAGSESNSSSSDNRSDDFHAGDTVEWNTAQGKTVGTVQKKITESISIKDYDVKASADNPKYVVKSDQTGAKAAHKPESLDPA